MLGFAICKKGVYHLFIIIIFLFIHFFLLMSFGLCLTGRKQFETSGKYEIGVIVFVLIDGKI